ncbi:NUDIX hydrolase [Pseudoramibacter sp.]|jgi:ADP-ribose pyrophosphatase YjhB (NUDIX family)|uniref:NUDIX hydrolase n=1 Tax=Pseudoramibacter sp. TaxID=2034862 RepID=UPI0025E44FB6|nr:NUDIX hydrolase N-terminal domain-containing protein [Pseudoramibacter sp.]MCH4072473.1 NUDIX hydrolase N-terminal domain-containing protein [Pseudoramibacter sp.]MCH4106244.1 NUDIX hydrolase N-terminal domain-containing protein [Pseudoramibacter sp.]
MADRDQIEPKKWIKWAQTLQAEAQSGLAYAANPFDIERYERLRDLSVEIMNTYTEAGMDKVRSMFANETGYQTPKVDVRGAVVKQGKILLVQEKLNDDCWSLPGGWADVGLSLKENIEKEVREEAGLDTKATRLVAIYNWLKSYKDAPFSMYKMVMLCEPAGAGHFADNAETENAAYFALGELPPLTRKVSRDLIARCLSAAKDWDYTPYIE